MTWTQRLVPVLLALVSFRSDARAAEPWHLPGWQARAIVEIPKPSTDAGTDTAGVKVLCQGRAKPDGADYRVLDAAGKPVSFQLMFHDAGRYSLLSFRAADPKQKYFVYFDNPKAERAAEQIVLDPTPGAGPLKAAWVPKQGLVLQTLQRPSNGSPDKEENPENVEQMTKLIEKSPFKHGARYQRNISDGYNPFGSSDYYISIYRGWIHIPKAGKYGFCTASNEASFSFMDGKELIHWPGQHSAEKGTRGEVNATVELTAGPHYVEYYHEEVTLDQMAFLGWKPEGEKFFAGIPDSAFPAAHEGKVTAYETPKGALLHFEPGSSIRPGPPSGTRGSTRATASPPRRFPRAPPIPGTSATASARPERRPSISISRWASTRSR